jgi:hypothetical protein
LGGGQTPQGETWPIPPRRGFDDVGGDKATARAGALCCERPTSGRQTCRWNPGRRQLSLPPLLPPSFSHLHPIPHTGPALPSPPPSRLELPPLSRLASRSSLEQGVPSPLAPPRRRLRPPPHRRNGPALAPSTLASALPSPPVHTSLSALSSAAGSVRAPWRPFS